MKIAVCDDDTFYREQIFTLIKNYADKNPSEEIVVKAFTHAEQLIEGINKGEHYDIFFLDIIMPGMNGIELGTYLREHGFDGKIVYVTTSDEFAISSYKVNASDYILKPYNNDEFSATLRKLVSMVSDKKKKFTLVKTKDRSIKLCLDDILYAELSRRNVIYHMSDGRTFESISVRTNFSDTVKVLSSDPRFVFCGKSLILNMHHISEVGNDAIVIGNNEVINAGKKLCREVRLSWADFHFSEVE